MPERREPTAAQIDFLAELRARSDHDPDWYDDPRRMSRGQVQAEIDKLLHELGYCQRWLRSGEEDENDE